MRVIIQGNWSDCVGTDYCDALGIYDDLDQAREDARDYAWDRWEPQWRYDEDDLWEDEGPDFSVEEYDPEIHDMLRAGGGSFEKDFQDMEKYFLTD